MPGTIRALARLCILAALTFGAIGCGDRPAPNTTAPGEPAPTDEVGKERAKLSPEDRAVVDAQEWCVISNEERLGSMGPPIKVVLKGQPVFVCCKGCVKRAEANPDKTLATAAELKAKAQAERAKSAPR